MCGEQLCGRKVPAEHLLLGFLGDSLLSELISSAMQIPVLEHTQKQEKPSSCLRVTYQLLSQVSAGDLNTNPVTLNALASFSLCFASNLDKGIIPALVNACSCLVILLELNNFTPALRGLLV